MNAHQRAPVEGVELAPNQSLRGWLGAAIMLTAISAFFMLREHWGHIFGYLPYALLLACPLMHLFGHGQGHGHGHAHSDSASPASTDKMPR